MSVLMQPVACWALTPVASWGVHTLRYGDTGGQASSTLIFIITTMTVHIVLVAWVTFTSETLVCVNAAAIFTNSISKQSTLINIFDNRYCFTKRIIFLCVGLWTGLTGGVPGLPDHRTAALFAGQVTRQGVLTDVLWWAGPSGCIVGRITVAFPHIHAFGLPFHQDIAVGTDTPIAATGVNTGAIPTQRSILIAFINIYTSVVHQSMAFGTHTGEAAKRVLALPALTKSVDLLTLIYVNRNPCPLVWAQSWIPRAQELVANCSIERTSFTPPWHFAPALAKRTAAAGLVNIGTNHIAANSPTIDFQITVTTSLVDTGCPCGVEDFVEGTLTDVAARNIDTGTVQAVVRVLTLIDICTVSSRSVLLKALVTATSEHS